MRLVIGGCAQGKLSYVMDRYGMQESCVMDGVLEMTCVSQEIVIVNHFHQWVKRCMEHEENPEQLIEEFLEKNHQESKYCIPTQYLSNVFHVPGRVLVT